MNFQLGIVIFCILLQVCSGKSEIGLSNFKKLVLEDDRVWMLKYYSERCGSCMEFEGEFQKVVKLVQNKIQIGIVSIDHKGAF